MEKQRRLGELDYELPHLDAALAAYLKSAAAGPDFPRNDLSLLFQSARCHLLFNSPSEPDIGYSSQAVPYRADRVQSRPVTLSSVSVNHDDRRFGRQQ